MEDVAVNEVISCAIQDYYELLGSIGHLHPNESKNLLIALMIDDYIINYDSFVTGKELECLEKMRKKAIQDSCILSRKVIC